MASYIKEIAKSYFENYSGLSKTCWQGIFINFIQSVLIGIYYFLPLYFINGLHLSITTSGLIVSFYGFGTIIGGFIGGKLSDIFSSYFVSIVSLLIQILIFSILPKISSPLWLIVDLFIMGISSYSFITSNYLWVLNQCGSNESIKLKAINILNVISNLGLALSATLIGLLTNLKFEYVIFLFSTLLLLATIYFIFFVSRKAQLCLNVNNIQIMNPRLLKNFNYSENKIISRINLGCLFFVGLIIFQSSTTYSMYIQKSFPQLGLKAVSILFTLNCLLVVFFQTSLGSMFSNYNKILIAGLGAFLLGFGMLLITFSSIFLFAIFSCIIYTIGEILFFSVSQYICYQNGDEKKKGQSLGIYRMVYAGSRVIAPSAGGFVYQQWGGNMVWYLCGIIGMLCLGICNYYKKYDLNLITK